MCRLYDDETCWLVRYDAHNYKNKMSLACTSGKQKEHDKSNFPSRHKTGTQRQDVDIWLNFGCDVRWPKSNVNSTSNDNVKLMSNTDVSWHWDFVVFRLCNQNPTLSQRQIDVKYWRQPDFHFQPKCNVCLTSCPMSTWHYIDVWCLLG